MFFVSTNIAKKLGTFGRHNFFFLLTFFSFFKESHFYIANMFIFFYFNWLEKQVKHHYYDELPTKLQQIEKILKIRFN